MTYSHPLPADAEEVPCRKDPELFFTQPTDAGHGKEGDRRIEKAKAICAGCPLRDPCLSYAITWAVEGVWGGTTLAERAKFRADNGLVPLPLIVSTQTMRIYAKKAS
jgi:WhiB family redox-sensing transcriptional regulator